MIDDLPEPARWSDSSPQSGTAEPAIGAAFRHVREATEPSDTALARAARRLNAPVHRTRGQLLWRLAIAVAVIMATGGAVGAALNRWRRANVVVPEPVVAGAASPRQVAARRIRRAVPASAADPSEPAPIAPAAPETPAAVAPVTPPAAVASAPVRERSAAAPVPQTLGAEIIAGAFRELRSHGDAAAALRSLDRYDRRFPNGLLRDESRIARVEALLLLDRRSEALRLLETAGAGVALTRDIAVTRGELLVESNRCPDALRDFDTVLATRDGDAAGGRALYGRASCRLRSGDKEGARADLTRYLSLHAGGPSAADARRALATLP